MRPSPTQRRHPRRQPRVRLQNVALCQNGMLLVFDHRGAQVPRLQGRATSRRVREILAHAGAGTAWELWNFPAQFALALKPHDWLKMWPYLMGLEPADAAGQVELSLRSVRDLVPAMDIDVTRDKPQEITQRPEAFELWNVSLSDEVLVEPLGLAQMLRQLPGEDPGGPGGWTRETEPLDLCGDAPWQTRPPGYAYGDPWPPPEEPA